MDPTQFGKGALDLPDDFLKPQAWRHEEIAGSFQPAEWKEKTSFVTYPKRNQLGQNTCVEYVLAKQIAVDELAKSNGEYRELSPRSLYPYVYKTDGGSSSLMASKLVTKQGMTLEILLPTDGLSEAQVRRDDGYATDAKLVAMIYKPDSFRECSADFDTIASIINGYRMQGLKKVVAVTVIGCNNGTWLSRIPVPPKTPKDPSIWYHRICITDFGLINGKKHLAFDNTWGEVAGDKGQQLLSEDYAPFIYGGIYTVQASDPSGDATVPTHTWNADLSLGSSGPDVLALQQSLQSMGYFPDSSVQKPTGIFGGVTRNAVVKFQEAFFIQPTGNVGPITREKLNEIFGG